MCVVRPEAANDVKAFVADLTNSIRLELQQDKVDEVLFPPSGRVQRPLQYLGLTFDGERILLRPGGIGRYYARMRGGVRREGLARRKEAERQGVAKADIRLRRKRLSERYSYRGKRNFISYALRASRSTGSKAIKRQVSRHWPVMQAKIRDEDD